MAILPNYSYAADSSRLQTLRTWMAEPAEADALRTQNLTILFVDIAGFTETTNRQSRLENAAMLDQFSHRLIPLIRHFQGRMVKSIGDALLLSFQSPTDAMLCAMAMQDCMTFHNQQLPAQQAIQIRVAAHSGEVRLTQHDIFGEAVNLAARIEAVTPSGKIYLSEAVYLAMNKTEVAVSHAGEQQLNGFTHPIHLYQVEQQQSNKGQDALPFGTDPKLFKLPVRQFRPVVWMLSAVLLLTMLSLAGWYWRQQSQWVLSPVPTKASSEFVQISILPPTNPRLTPAYLYGLELALKDAIRRVPGFYQHEEQSQVQAQWLIEISFNPQQPDLQLALKLYHRLSGQTFQSSWQWQQKSVQRTLQRLDNQIAAWLAATQHLQPWPADAATEINPTTFLQWLQLAQQAESATDARQFQQILDKLAPIIAAYPNFAPGQLLQCTQAVQLYRSQAELKVLTIAKQVCPGLATATANAQAWFAFGLFLETTAQPEKALQAYQNAIVRDPKMAAAYSGMASIYLQKGQDIEAQSVYQQAINVQPNYWKPVHAMALFQMERGQFSQAIVNYQKVVEMTPNSSGAYSDLGAAFYMSGQLQAAADQYAKATLLDEDEYNLSNLGTLYYYLGRLNDATNMFQRAVGMSPQKAELQGNLADAIRHAAQPATAVPYYQRAIQLLQEKQKPSGKELALWAHYLSCIGDITTANNKMQLALDADPNNPEVHLLHALVAMKQQQKAEAMQAVLLALRFGYSKKLLSVEPDLQELTSDPTFLALLMK